MMGTQLLLPLLLTAVITASLAALNNYYVLKDEAGVPLLMTWSDALNECRFGYTDMLTLDVVSASDLSSITEDLGVVWMGLQRDMHNDSAWNWINTINVEPTTGDFFQSLKWNDQGHSSHCAFYNSDSTWSSKRCAEEHPFFCSSVNGAIYYNTSLSWHDARKVCQDEQGGDLPTLTEALSSFIQGEFGWIGLYRVGGEEWMWAEGQSLTYSAWMIGEPVTNDCAAFNAKAETWQSYPCDTPLNAMCFLDMLVMVHETKTWEEALEHCKSLDKTETCPGTNDLCDIQHSLVTVAKPPEYAHVKKRLSGAMDEIWTGLRFLGGHWWWVSGDPVNHRIILPNCPDHLNHCGAFSKTANSPFITDCAKKLYFICHKQTLKLE